MSRLETEIKVGLFITVGLGLVLSAILILGGNQTLFTQKNQYVVKFPNVEGLMLGAKVILGGVPVGTVEKISFDQQDHKKIAVMLSVVRTAEQWIRQDSMAEIATQGVLGDKNIIVGIGSETETVLPTGSEIKSQAGKDIAHFLNKGDQLMVSLNVIASSLQNILKSFEADNRNETFFKGLAQTSKNFSQASDRFNKEMDQIEIKKTIHQVAQIAEKINNGTGTIGALINDPGLYDEIKALFGGVNRNRIVRNLVRQAIKDKNEPKSDH